MTDPSEADLAALGRDAETYATAMAVIDDDASLTLDPAVVDLVQLVLCVETFTAATACSLLPVRALINAGRYADARATYDSIMASYTPAGR